MQCPGCGLNYPGDFGSCPRRGHVASLQGEMRPEFFALRGLANVLPIVLGRVVAAIVVRLVLQFFGPARAHGQRSFIDLRLDKAADLVMFGLGIGFVVWFRRARINAEHRGWPQRRARGWALRGWIVPVVSLRIPFQIMGDIWRAGLPASQRRSTAWLPADTWTGSLCFLAVSGLTLIAIIRVVSKGPLGSPAPGPPDG